MVGLGSPISLILREPLETIMADLHHRWQLAWITGGSSGIGLELAKRLAAGGAKVVVSARSEERLKAACRDVSGLIPLPLDVADGAAVRAAVDRIVAEHGVPDLVVLNAGLWRQFDMREGMDPADSIASMEVNYFGQVHAIAALLPHFMQRKSGHFALMASVAGYRGLPRASAYGPSKAATISLGETMRAELSGTGIDVSVINPGFVDTPMTSENEFPMPFIISADKAADLIFRGLLRRKFEIAFPWQMVAILKLARVLPYWFYFWLIRRSGGPGA